MAERSCADLIQASRRENLPWWGRLILLCLPNAVYRQVLREYDIGMETLGWEVRRD